MKKSIFVKFLKYVATDRRDSDRRQSAPSPSSENLVDIRRPIKLIVRSIAMSLSLSCAHPPCSDNNNSISNAGKQHHATSTELVLPAEAEVDDNVLDNYNLDAEGNDEHSLSRKMVHYCGGEITQEHWLACKEVLVFYAGSSTSKLTSLTKVIKGAACLRLYKACIAALHGMSFSDDARDFLAGHSKRRMTR